MESRLPKKETPTSDAGWPWGDQSGGEQLLHGGAQHFHISGYWKWNIGDTSSHEGAVRHTCVLLAFVSLSVIKFKEVGTGAPGHQDHLQRRLQEATP